MELTNFFKRPARNAEEKTLKIFLAGVLPLMAVLTVVSIWNAAETKTRVAEEITRQKSGNAAKKIILFLDPVVRDIKFLRYLGARGELGPNLAGDSGEFLAGFSTFYLSNVSRVILSDGDKIFLHDLEKEDRGSAPTVDDRCLAFIEETIKRGPSDKIRWSETFQSSNGEKTHVYASAVFPGDASGKLSVIVFDIDITGFIQAVDEELTDSSRLFLIGDKGIRDFRIIFRENGRADSSPPSRDPLIVEALDIWHGAGDERPEVFSFTSGGKKWWAGMQNIAEENGLIPCGIIVAEDSILRKVREGGLTTLVYSAVSFLVVLAATLILWQRHMLSIRQADRPPKLSRADNHVLANAIGQGENDRLEFKSTLRWNLKSGKPGKEIEIAAMKTVAAYLNSNGGSLMVGVDDNGDISGIEADQFASDDKCLLHVNNLIKRHIGLEASRYIAFDIREMEGKKILVVDCEKSEKPVFLKNADAEEFYIRVGPGSRKLSISETMAYVGLKK